MEKVIKYCTVKNRWVGMVYYQSGMVKEFFTAKPKLRQLNSIAKTARHYIAIDREGETDW